MDESSRVDDPEARWHVGVDVGGTFTDFYACHRESRRVHVYKRPSTPDDPGRAILAGLEELAVHHGVSAGGLARLAHGTTVGTNALIERRGGKVVLLTTSGFRDLLEIGRQTRPHMFDLFADFPPPLVPREHRFEVAERVTTGGEVVRALGAEAIEEAVRRVCDQAPGACAVCLLFSFENPSHERALGEALRRAAPGLPLSLSCDVQPEFREYERFSTTVLNAYLQPVMSAYLERLESELTRRAPRVTIGINQSSGGLMSPRRAQELPVRTALSGPAAGVVGALHVARLGAREDVITLDMGGTSADVALIRGRRADIAYHREVAGFPVRLPMVDIETVGAGGGSIAWFDRDGLLKVGPRSAGAAPGPACYAQGGSLPTVTDANLLLGRLSPRGLLGGEMALEVPLARRAFEPVAARLGFGVERAAHGVLGVAVANMVRAIRTLSVERGHDPRAHTLMPFGGAGPLHARDVAASLGISEVLVPGAPGIVCAQGLVVSDLTEDFVLSQRSRLDRDTLDRVRERVAKLLGLAARWFAVEAIPPEKRGLDLRLDMRYVGQNFELPVPLEAGAAGTAALAVPDLDALVERFYRVHEASYGYHSREDPVEVVNYRLTARGRVFDEALPERTPPRRAAPAPSAHREVWFSGTESVRSAVYLRESLEPGHRIEGPAVVEQLDATTLIFPRDSAHVDAAGNLVISLASGGH